MFQPVASGGGADAVPSPRAILVSVMALIVLAGGLAAHEYGRISQSFFSQAALAEGRAARDRLNLTLSAPLAAQGLAARLLAQAGPQPLDPERTRSLLLSTLADDPVLTSTALLDAQGVFALAERTSDGLATYVRTEDGSEAFLRLAAKEGENAATVPVDTERLAEFERVMAQAVANRHAGWPAWTERHPVPGQPGPSISAVVPAGPGSAESRFLAFDFGLDALWRAVSGAAPEQSRVLVFTPDGHLLDPGQAHEDHRAAASAAPLYVERSSSGDPLLTAAMDAWLAAGRPVQGAFSFQSGGQVWWASLSPLSEDRDRTSVGLAIPRDELLGLTIEDNRVQLAIAGGLVLALGLLAVLAFRGRRGVGSGAGEFFGEAREIRALLDKGESEKLEFKSTLRFNLAAGKPGKEIELACLKTLTAFMNTDGGVLAVGVDDQGRVVGLAADNFENDDHALRHFSSLFAQHIGVEHLPCVTFGLRELEGQKVLLVECRKSEKPVILKTGKEEEFYVRAGPSSRKLSLSEFMRRLSG